MDQVNQGNNQDAQPNIMPVKRKRGRPRKDQTLKRRENAPPVPPGFGVFNGNQPPRQVVAIENPADNIVGQPVTGVVEAAFDAGYLLAVKIGNSNTSLRGVVFKPGHFVPISSENDVAPHVPMIRRNEIPLPMEKQTRVRGRRRRSNKQHDNNIPRIETGHFFSGYPPANQVHMLAPTQSTDLAASSKGKQMVPVSAYSAAPFVGARGTVVPVVLQPVSFSNGLPPPFNQMAPVPIQAGHTMIVNHNPMQTVMTQVAPSPPQTTHQLTPNSVQNGPTSDEVSRRVQVSSQPYETRIENSSMGDGKSSADGSGLSGEGDSDTSEPLSVEPLQVIHSNIRNQSGPVFSPENNRIGRMSELLKAVQENMIENNQVSRVENKVAAENDPTR